MSSLSPLESTRFCILLALAKEPMHGADIERQIMIDSRNAVYINFSTFYKTLKLLEQRDLIQATIPAPYPVRKSGMKAYMLTPPGQRILKNEIHRLKDSITVANQRIAEK